MKKVPPEVGHSIIRHHFVDQWPVGTIAQQLCVHHDVVRRVLKEHGCPPRGSRTRTRMVDPYVAYIDQTLQAYPKLHASRLFQMVQQRGYPGSASHFRRVVAELRPRPSPEPFLRLDMPPGEQAQVDWGHFGSIQVGRAKRPVYAFVIVLSWSRMLWLHFFHDMQMGNFLRGHIDAFTFFEGVPRCLLYDNLKSAVIERADRAIRFNEELLEFASHYGFEPRAAAPRRGNEKGRVERSIRYIRTNFFAAREFNSLHNLNEQALEWNQKFAAKRRWPDDDSKIVVEQFKEETSRLRGLPPTPFEAWTRIPAKVGRTPYVRFDTNDYSVPASCVRREVLIQADHQVIRIIADSKVVAEHQRIYDRRATVTAPGHLSEIVDFKRRARQATRMNRLTTAVPTARTMLDRAAQRGQTLGSLIAQLLELLDIYGTEELGIAITEVNDTDRVGFKPVRLILEQRSRQKNRTPPRTVRMRNQALKNILVKNHDLSAYDRLGEDNADSGEHDDSHKR